MNVQTKTKGFTIIEVVLVLAIAGLIFLIVFLALPALQRQQRDTQRRSDLGRVIAAIQSYQSNNTNKLPQDFNGSTVAVAGQTALIGTSYLGTFNDPSTTSSYVSVETQTTVAAAKTAASAAATATWVTGNIYAVANRDCDDGAAAGKVAVVIGLESGGSYCQAN